MSSRCAFCHVNSIDIICQQNSDISHGKNHLTVGFTNAKLGIRFFFATTSTLAVSVSNSSKDKVSDSESHVRHRQCAAWPWFLIFYHLKSCYYAGWKRIPSPSRMDKCLDRKQCLARWISVLTTWYIICPTLCLKKVKLFSLCPPGCAVTSFTSAIDLTMTSRFLIMADISGVSYF